MEKYENVLLQFLVAKIFTLFTAVGYWQGKKDKNLPKEILTALGVVYMLNSNIYFLLNPSVLNAFVNNNTNSTLCNIEHSACFTMVDLVWHTNRISTVALINLRKRRNKSSKCDGKGKLGTNVLQVFFLFI